MVPRETVSLFPENPDVPPDEVERNMTTRGKTKLTSFPRDQKLSALLYFFPSIIIAKQPERATTAALYPGRDTFEFDQEHVTKNHPITVLVSLSESLAIALNSRADWLLKLRISFALHL